MQGGDGRSGDAEDVPGSRALPLSIPRPFAFAFRFLFLMGAGASSRPAGWCAGQERVLPLPPHPVPPHRFPPSLQPSTKENPSERVGRVVDLNQEHMVSAPADRTLLVVHTSGKNRRRRVQEIQESSHNPQGTSSATPAWERQSMFLLKHHVAEGWCTARKASSPSSAAAKGAWVVLGGRFGLWVVCGRWMGLVYIEFGFGRVDDSRRRGIRSKRAKGW
jgi:hypothetical protein